MFSNVDSIIADLRSELNKYASANLIDETSLYRDITLSLKGFGNDVSIKHEKVLEVRDGFVELPSNFFSLSFAYLCEPAGYRSNVEKHHLQSSLLYKETTRFRSDWNECDSSCCEDQSETVVRENLYLDMGRIEFYYKKPILLKLGESFQKSSCHFSCRNQIVRDCPYEVSITNFTMSTNFNQGYVYIQYYGLPIDNKGNIEIPSTPNGNMEFYMEYMLKRRVSERLIANGDAGPGLKEMYPTYKQEEIRYRRKSSNELKMMNLKPSLLLKEAKMRSRLLGLQYETNIQWPGRGI